MLKRFLSYYKPHKKIFVLDMLASLSVALLGILYPIVTRTMLNDLIPNRQYTHIIIAGVSLFVLYFIRMLLNYFIQYQGHMMGVRMQGQMRSEMFRHLEKLPFSFYDNNETGRIMTRITSDLFEVTEFAHHCPEEFFIAAIKITVPFVILMGMNPILTLIVFAMIPLMIFCTRFFNKKMRQTFKERNHQVGEINAQVQWARSLTPTPLPPYGSVMQVTPYAGEVTMGD